MDADTLELTCAWAVLSHNRGMNNLAVARARISRLPSLACLGLGGITAAQAQDMPTVTPYRPSVSTPAALSAPGWVEVEAGLQASQGDDPVRRHSLPYTLKLAFTADWGIRIGGDALVRERYPDGSSLRGTGDTTVVLKRRLAVDDASAFGIELGLKLPTARSGLGSGYSDVGINGIYSRDFAAGWHIDMNLLATHLGGADPLASAWQKAWAVAVSRNLDEHWGIVGELSGTQRRGAGSTTQALVAASYAVSPTLTVDFGVSKGLGAASGGWSVFSGATYLAGRLF